jgi:chromatin remodeling complex protein RSC6
MAKKKSATQKVYELSDEFYEYMGLAEGTRGQAVKAVWDFAKEHGLNTSKKKNGRNQACIKTDPFLRKLFGSKEYLFMGDISKGISEHLWELEE